MIVRYHWDGEVMVPLPRYVATCARDFTVGETYPLKVHEDRSLASHNHFFATLHKGYGNLPHGVAELFPNVDALRKYALIKAGYCDSRQTVFASEVDARRAAALLHEHGDRDEFVVVTVRGAVLTVYTAQSQGRAAMGKNKFERSKQDVLEIVAGMVGVSVDDLAKARSA